MSGIDVSAPASDQVMQTLPPQTVVTPSSFPPSAWVSAQCIAFSVMTGLLTYSFAPPRQDGNPVNKFAFNIDLLAHDEYGQLADDVSAALRALILKISVYGNFDIIFDHVSRIAQLCTTLHAPCDVSDFVPIGC